MKASRMGATAQPAVEYVLSGGSSNANDTYTVPAGVHRLWVECWGGGGGCSASDAGFSLGAGGGAFVGKWIDVTPGDELTIKAGARGASGQGPCTAAGTSGSASTVSGTDRHGVAISLSAGGGVRNSSGGAGGTASGGDINVNGQTQSGAAGGDSPFGGAGGAGNASGASPGGGGGRRTGSCAPGTQGGVGRVQMWTYPPDRTDPHGLSGDTIPV